MRSQAGVCSRGVHERWGLRLSEQRAAQVVIKYFTIKIKTIIKDVRRYGFGESPMPPLVATVMMALWSGSATRRTHHPALAAVLLRRGLQPHRRQAHAQARRRLTQTPPLVASPAPPIAHRRPLRCSCRLRPPQPALTAYFAPQLHESVSTATKLQIHLAEGGGWAARISAAGK